MKCPICKHGDTMTGTASITLEKNAATLVFKGVPAQICNNCGEEYFTDNITQSIMKQAELAIAQGVQIDVRQYRAA
ncbi:MAG: type II toxin-antitoxin system MqsA family antitoxin [Methylobacter sp.]|uniref:Type II toxin-antitoxin system MqsA family antitoxin n=1 Tax=Candidatus Methylobacter titanis TaxID=3053457 RepID=A0AA43Q583_9GAMM|nr:type II toxin-antitoxin system MqsA family antitoxin [Candidatus Methylobacter titanis]